MYKQEVGVINHREEAQHTPTTFSTLLGYVIHRWGSTYVLLDYLCRPTCPSLGKSQCFTWCLHTRLAHFQLHADGNPHSCLTALLGKKTWREEKRIPAFLLLDLHSMANTYLFTREPHAKWPQCTTEEPWSGSMTCSRQELGREFASRTLEPAMFTRKCCVWISAQRKAKVKAERHLHRTAQKRQCEKVLLSHRSWTSAEELILTSEGQHHRTIWIEV